jgi:hypothetical protein
VIKKKYTREEIEELLRLAFIGELPKDFNDWDLTDSHGRTIAHKVAGAGHLPKNFGKDDPLLWALADKQGWTVAHEAALYNHLPEDFGKDDPSLWDMKDDRGITVKKYI